jgi:hypothetical protein
MKQSYKQMSMVFNNLVRESRTQTLLFDILKVLGTSNVVSSRYTSSGAEAVVEYVGKKYKVTVEPIRR